MVLGDASECCVQPGARLGLKHGSRFILRLHAKIRAVGAWCYSVHPSAACSRALERGLSTRAGLFRAYVRKYGQSAYGAR